MSSQSSSEEIPLVVAACCDSPYQPDVKKYVTAHIERAKKDPEMLFAVPRHVHAEYMCAAKTRGYTYQCRRTIPLPGSMVPVGCAAQLVKMPERVWTNEDSFVVGGLIFGSFLIFVLTHQEEIATTFLRILFAKR